MNNLFLGQGDICEFSVQLGAVAVEHGKIERAEIRVKVFVDQFIVYAEVVSVGGGLGSHWGLQGDKVQPVGDVLGRTDQHVTVVVVHGRFSK